MNTILVQMADARWTMEALHLACSLARGTEAEVVLLRLIRVDHISYLGSDAGDAPLTSLEYELIQGYRATAEDYGVAFSMAQMQCIAPMDAIVEAASALDVDTVFAQVPDSWMPYLRAFRLRWLTMKLGAHRRQLYTLDKPEAQPTRTPIITVRTRHA